MTELDDLIENTCSPEESAARVAYARQELSRELAKRDPLLLADAQALADVRTLDGHDPNWHMLLAAVGYYCQLPSCPDSPIHHGPTPDEARAKAAAWVRAQAR